MAALSMATQPFLDSHDWATMSSNPYVSPIDTTISTDQMKRVFTRAERTKMLCFLFGAGMIFEYWLGWYHLTPYYREVTTIIELGAVASGAWWLHLHGYYCGMVNK